MGHYQIWNKKDTINTPSGVQFTAQEWIDKYPWVKIDGAKMIITTGIINGGVVMEYESAKRQYKNMGANITDNMTVEEVLEAIEEFETRPPIVDDSPSVEERTAAALEFLAMQSLPDEV